MNPSHTRFYDMMRYIMARKTDSKTPFLRIAGIYSRKESAYDNIINFTSRISHCETSTEGVFTLAWSHSRCWQIISITSEARRPEMPFSRTGITLFARRSIAFFLLKLEREQNVSLYQWITLLLEKNSAISGSSCNRLLNPMNRNRMLEISRKTFLLESQPLIEVQFWKSGSINYSWVPLSIFLHRN